MQTKLKSIWKGGCGPRAGRRMGRSLALLAALALLGAACGDGRHLDISRGPLTPEGTVKITAQRCRKGAEGTQGRTKPGDRVALPNGQLTIRLVADDQEQTVTARSDKRGAIVVDVLPASRQRLGADLSLSAKFGTGRRAPECALETIDALALLQLHKARLSEADYATALQGRRAAFLAAARRELAPERRESERLERLAVTVDLAGPFRSDVLAIALRDPNVAVRAAAISRADNLPSGSLLSLVKLAAQDSDPGIRAQAETLMQGLDWARAREFEALLAAGGQNAPAAVLRAMADRYFWIRVRATESLPLLPRAQSVPLLVKTLNDPHPYVRVAAVRSLAALGEPQAAAALAKCGADDPYVGVRTAAAAALRRTAK